MKRLLGLPIVIALLTGAATADAAEEPAVSAGRSSSVIALDHDAGVVLFDSATRNIDPLVHPREPQGTYLWTPAGLGRVEQIGSIALDVTADARTAVMIDRPNGFFGPHRQARVFSVEANTGLEVVSVGASGEEANADVCCGVSISADGRYVAFASAATNLAGGGGGVFLRDRRDRTTTRIAPSGNVPVLSDDASTVVYTDSLSVYVRDLPDGDPELLTASGGSPDVDGDGDVVAYTQYDNEAGTSEVVVLDRTTEHEVRIVDAFTPSLSADGTRVAYTVMHEVGTSSQTLPHVYVRDLVTGATTLASRTPSGRPGNAGSVSPQLSGDGRTVVFESAADDLVPGVIHAPGSSDLFLTRLDTGAVELLTVGRDAGVHHLRADGFVNSYGAAQPRTPDPRLDGAVAIAAPTFRDGFWVANRAGRVARAGPVRHWGEVTVPLAAPIVGVASSASGHGYWLVAADGGIFSFGDAAFHGSTGAMRLNRPIVAMARTRTGEGYWLVASDGGIFSFGDAAFHGSTGAIALNQPIVAMVRTASGRGYRLVAADGGVFAFGDASHIWGPSNPACCIVDAAGS